MILSAGLTPAWQQTLLFEQLTPGEVNRAIESHWCASGKVLNAAAAVHHLGGPSRLISVVGGPAREEIEQDMAQMGVEARWIVTHSRTRVCTTVIDRSAHVTTELVEEALPLSDDELDAFQSAYADEAVEAEAAILSGSLPQGVPTSLYRDLVEATACPVILDFRGDGLRQTLDLEPLLVKPNREELGNTAERELTDDADVHRAMRELNAAGARWVLVTQGNGPLWLSSKDELHEILPLEAESYQNTIGSGDTLAAGVACGLREGREMTEAVRLGVAAATLNIETILPARFDGRRAHLLAERVEMRRID